VEDNTAVKHAMGTRLVVFGSVPVLAFKLFCAIGKGRAEVRVALKYPLEVSLLNDLCDRLPGELWR
jgi:hypothetical protein